MGFLAPWFLIAAAGVALPLYLHLLKRQTTAPKEVSSLMLYESRTQASTRHRRLRYFLLLSLRLLWLLLLIVSDFWESPETLIRTIEPLRYRGNEVVLFHVLDPEDVRPKLNRPSILVDSETKQELEVTPDYTRKEYREKIDAHLADLRDRTLGAGMGYYLLMTNRPLDSALREYLTLRGVRK